MTELKSAESWIEAFNELRWKNETERNNNLSMYIQQIQKNAIEATIDVTISQIADNQSLFESLIAIKTHKKLKV